MGIMIFARTCLLDMKSIFVKIDSLTKQEKSKMNLIKYVKEAVVLHERVNGFVFFPH